MARFARRNLWGICAAVSAGSQCVVARFARLHLWGICAAVSVGLQGVVARFARSICAAVNVESQCVVARFARRHITDICAADSVGSQYVVARFARKHLKGVCAAVSVGVAVRSGSRVLVLLLLVFVHDYNRARRLGNCVLLLEPPRTTAIVVQYSRPHTSPFARDMVKLTLVPKCRVGQTWRNAQKGRAIAVEER